MEVKLFLVLAVIGGSIAALILIRYAVRGLWRPQAPMARQSQSQSQGGGASFDGWTGSPFWRWVARLAALAGLVSVGLQVADMVLSSG